MRKIAVKARTERKLFKIAIKKRKFLKLTKIMNLFQK